MKISFSDALFDLHFMLQNYVENINALYYTINQWHCPRSLCSLNLNQNHDNICHIMHIT